MSSLLSTWDAANGSSMKILCFGLTNLINLVLESRAHSPSFHRLAATFVPFWQGGSKTFGKILILLEELYAVHI